MQPQNGNCGTSINPGHKEDRRHSDPEHGGLSSGTFPAQFTCNFSQFVALDDLNRIISPNLQFKLIYLLLY